MPNILGNPNKDASKYDAVNTNDVEDGGNVFEKYILFVLYICFIINHYWLGESGHGDELIYLYDVRTIEGKPISGTELKDKRDIEMRNNFTSIVAEFVRNG